MSKATKRDWLSLLNPPLNFGTIVTFTVQSASLKAFYEAAVSNLKFHFGRKKNNYFSNLSNLLGKTLIYIFLYFRRLMSEFNRDRLHNNYIIMAFSTKTTKFFAHFVVCCIFGKGFVYIQGIGAFFRVTV